MVHNPLSCALKEPFINFYDLLTPGGGGLLSDLEHTYRRLRVLPAVQCNHEIV